MGKRCTTIDDRGSQRLGARESLAMKPSTPFGQTAPDAETLPLISDPEGGVSLPDVTVVAKSLLSAANNSGYWSSTKMLEIAGTG